MAPMSGVLYIVATPIGNLGDLSSRALETLKHVDGILAEDPRQTLKLLNRFGIQKKIYPYTDHASEEQHQRILEELTGGKSFALVSDAGTPGISDPGARLVEFLIFENSTHRGPIIPIPGPCAVSTLLSVFGKSAQSFHFWGFFPKKPGEAKKQLAVFEQVPGIHVFFESPHRILKTLERYLAPLDDSYYIVIGREITKKHETFYRGSPKEVAEAVKQGSTKGEFCIGVMKAR